VFAGTWRGKQVAVKVVQYRPAALQQLCHTLAQSSNSNSSRWREMDKAAAMAEQLPVTSMVRRHEAVIEAAVAAHVSHPNIVQVRQWKRCAPPCRTLAAGPLATLYRPGNQTPLGRHHVASNVVMAVIVVIHRIQGRLLCLSQVYTYALKPCFSTGCMQQQVQPSTHSTMDDASPWLEGAGGPSSHQQQQQQQQEREQLQGGVITSWELHLVMEYCDQVRECLATCNSF